MINKKILESKYASITIITILSFALYLVALQNDFVIDDKTQLLGNPWIKDFSYAWKFLFSGVWDYLQSDTAVTNYYRPLHMLIFMVEWHIFGPVAWGWHLVCILFHTTNAILVFLIFSEFFKENKGGTPDVEYKKGVGLKPHTLALMGALIFTATPVNTESVAWISAIPEESFVLFSLLSFYLYIINHSNMRSVSYIFSVAAFFLATLSKETAFALPLLIVAHDALKREEPFKRNLIRYVPFGMTAVLYLSLRFHSLKGLAPAFNKHPYLTDFQIFLNIPSLFIDYIRTLLVPVNLIIFHDFDAIYSITETKALMSIILTIILLVAVARLWKSDHLYLLSFLFIVIPLLPVFYIPVLDRSAFGERYLYMPSVGFALFLITALRHIVATWRAPNKKALIYYILAGFLTLMALYSYGTIKRVLEWKNEVTLLEATVRKDPGNYLALFELGTIFRKNEMIEESNEMFEDSIAANNLRRYPDPNKLVFAHHILGDYHFDNANLDKAMAHYKDALRLAPKRLHVIYAIARIEHKKKNFVKAVGYYRSALSVAEDPWDKKAILINLALVNTSMGYFPRAEAQYRESLKLFPGDQDVAKKLREIREIIDKSRVEKNGIKKRP